jgi:hypothetical protein
MAYAETGRGLNDVAIYPLIAADALGTKVDFPGAQALEFSTEVDSDTIGGDDAIIAVAYGAKTGSGSLTTARANLTALAAMLGGTVASTGTTPNIVQTLDETSAAPQGYFAIKGQTLGADTAGSAYEVTIWKAKAGGVSETMEFEAWHTPQINFEFIDNSTPKMITRKLQETRVALA